MKTRFASLFAVAALVLAACSGGSSETTTTSTAPSTTMPTDQTTERPASTTSTTAPPQSSTTTTTTEQPTTTSTTTTDVPDDGVVRIAVEVSNGEVVGGVTSVVVERGAVVELTVTADVSEEVHVHAYDEFGEVAEGEPVTITFTADIPGVFEVELEGTGLLVVELEVG